MKTIIGRVSSLDARGKSFTVSAFVKGTDGKDVTKQIRVLWSNRTAFISKGKRKVSSVPSKIKPEIEVIVQIDTTQSGKSVAKEVWHQTSGGALLLTAAECRDLGGRVTADSDCPRVFRSSLDTDPPRARCTTAGGSRCIDE